MSGDTIEEKVRVTLDGEQAKREASTIEQRMGKMFETSALKAAVFNQALALGQRALGGLVNLMQDGIKSALEYERTTRQLGLVLKNLGDTNGYWLGQLQQQSSVLERLTGISDETIRRYQVMALNMGTASDRVDDLIRASVSLGNAMDIDVRTAMVQIVKTQTGLVEETLKATGAVAGLTKEQLQAGKAIDIINEKFGEQLTVMTQGGAGATVGLATAWANVGEEMVKFFTEAETGIGLVQALASAVQQMADGLTNIRNLDPAAIGKAYLGALTAPVTGLLGAAGIGAYAAGSGGTTEDIPLEPLVPPDAVGGARAGAVGGGRKGGKGGKGGESEDFQFEMNAEWNEDMVMTASGNFVTRDNFEAAIALRTELTEQANGLQNDMMQSQLEYQISISDMVIADEQRVADEKKRLAQEAAEEQKKWSDMGAKVVTSLASTAVNAMVAWASGQEVSLGKIAGDFLSAIGQMLIAQGTIDIYKGVSRALGTYGLDPTATALIAHGGIELAAGMAMAAGGGAIGAMAAPSGGAGGGSKTMQSVNAGGGVSDFAAGGGERSSYNEGGGKTYIININGPVLNDHQFGSQVQAAIDETVRLGL